MAKLNVGPKNHRWNGGRDKINGDYVRATVYGGPQKTGGPEKTRYTRRHTLIAEKALGRRLKRGEVVHHINGLKADNRNCNLLICSRSYHYWLHEEMARRYQLEHFGNL